MKSQRESSARRSSVQSQAERYAGWIRALREGHVPPSLADDHGPLSALGRELQHLADEITRRETQVRNLLALVQTAHSGILLDDVLDTLFDGFSGCIPFERIGCAFLSEDGSSLAAYWAKSTLGPVRIGSGYSQRLRGSTLEAILTSGQPRILNDLRAYLASKPSSDSTRRIVEEGGRSSLTCPLFAQGQAIGFLFFTSAQVGAYHELHPAIFGQIAGQVSIVIQKARMYERLVAHNKTLADQSRRFELIASTDSLTGLLNRRTVDTSLGEAWERYGAGGTSFSVIMADIDHFKSINDTHGHATGDVVLREVADRLRRGVRAGDTVGRYGGEEFLIVLPDATGSLVEETAERLRRTISEEMYAGERAIRVTASFGSAAVDRSVVSAGALIDRADAALYEAKRRGRNCSVAAPGG